MTEEYALAFIKAQMPEDDSDLKNQKARVALEATVNFFNLLGEYTWNQQKVEMSLTSGDSSWEVVDLVPDYTVRKFYDEDFWMIDESGKIEIVDRQVFNAQKRGHTSSGKPRIACVHSKDAILEVYPTPDQDYNVWAMVGVMITGFNDMPSELQLPVIHLAIMSVIKADQPAYAQSAGLWSLTEKKILTTKEYTTWAGSEMKGDDFAPGTSGHGGFGPSAYDPLNEGSL